MCDSGKYFIYFSAKCIKLNKPLPKLFSISSCVTTLSQGAILGLYEVIVHIGPGLINILARITSDGVNLQMVLGNGFPRTNSFKASPNIQSHTLVIERYGTTVSTFIFRQ